MAYLKNITDKLEEKVVLKGECWIWQGSVNWCGYGYFVYRDNGTLKGMMAHRAVYKALVGDIPEGLTMDHQCKNKTCVNPMHFEFETLNYNLMRGNSASAVNKRKTQCIRGHDFGQQSEYYRKHGHRRCRQCHNEDERLRRKRRVVVSLT